MTTTGPLDRRAARAVSLRELIAEAEAAGRSGASFGARSWPTGFVPLDEYLGGGVRGGELVLVGGPQGQGKTTFVLQVARAIAAGGAPVVYVSYEHPADDVLARLLGMESGLQDGLGGFRLVELRRALQGDDQTLGGLVERLSSLPGGVAALDAVERIGQRFSVVGASGRPLDVAALRRLVLEPDEPPVLVVDYLQKVGDATPGRDEQARVTRVTESLKDLALEAGVPVVAVVAAEAAGIASGRVRLHHLRGSSALAYEADVALMINNKYDSVARDHLTFSTTNAERFREQVVCSIEKNRAGRDRVDLEFTTRFDQGCFDPLGGVVVERLVDDRLAGG